MKEDIISITKRYCVQRLLKSRCSTLQFHNLKHTLEVYENVLKIGRYEKLDVDELEPVLLAALFHDIGNRIAFKGHENYSANEAFSFLVKYNYSSDKTALVCNCINATQMPQNPKNIYESIICDADLYHLGTKMFFLKCKLLRKEWLESMDIDYSDTAWNALNIHFLEQHRFHTMYGKNILEPVKQENIRLLKKEKDI